MYKAFLPKIAPIFDVQKECRNHFLYEEIIRSALCDILAGCPAFEGEDISQVQQLERLTDRLPLVTTKQCQTLPGDISFFALSKLRPNSFKFFFDMLNSWLLPGKRLNVVMVYAVDFRMPEIGEETYTLCEVIIRVKNVREMEQILRSFSLIESEIRLGIASSHYSRRVLEIKGLNSNEKTALIQGDIAYLMERRPKQIDYDIFTEMQHVLVICPEEFKAVRECRHLSRLVSVHYLLRQSMRKDLKQSPHTRHLTLKISRARLKLDNQVKPVLSIIACVNFFRDKERLEKNHLLKAIQNYIPSAAAVENSFFANRRGAEPICTLYLEIEKSSGGEFSSDEIRMLRQALPSDLKERIEHLMHPVFMPRNEEEIIRNILSLSAQIRFLRDIPQVFISFEEQSPGSLYFTVILVRVLKAGSPSIQDMFRQANSFLEYIHDRCQKAGSLRRKYAKEATVFRLKLPKDLFLRQDHSIDINRARKVIVSELCSIVGEVRDFNGGMISKQNEALEALKILLNDFKYNELLLDKFFYSLTPVIMRNVLEPEVLRTIFILLLETMQDTSSKQAFKMIKDDAEVFAVVKFDDRSLREEIGLALSKLSIHSHQLAASYVSIHEVFYAGYVYRTSDREKQQLFCHTIQSVLATKEAKKIRSTWFVRAKR